MRGEMHNKVPRMYVCSGGRDRAGRPLHRVLFCRCHCAWTICSAGESGSQTVVVGGFGAAEESGGFGAAVA